MRVDTGRRAYIGAWMALALEEAKKINNQRRCERGVAFHALESTVVRESSRRRILTAGISLVAATLLFAVVFAYLATTFDYPGVLARPAGEVLPQLLGLGTTGRIVWIVYGLIPLLLIPTARGVREVAQDSLTGLGKASVWLAAVSAVSMMIGLLRWPTLHWMLAANWASATDAMQDAMAAQFSTANIYLGNVIGEFVGELFLNAFFLIASLALARQARFAWLRYAGVVAAAIGWTAMLRNITTMVSLVADANNTVLPVWMLTIGIALIVVATRRQMTAGVAPADTSRRSR